MIAWHLLRKLLSLIAISTSVWAGTTLTIHSNVVIRDPGNGKGFENQLLIEDHNGAPMWWTNLFGSFSGGEPICATDATRYIRPVVCLGGPVGTYGTSPEIVFYHNGKVWKIIQ